MPTSNKISHRRFLGIDFSLADHVHIHVWLFMWAFLVDDFLPASDRDLFNVQIIWLVNLLLDFNHLTVDLLICFKYLICVSFSSSPLLHFKRKFIVYFVLSHNPDKVYILGAHEWILSRFLDDFTIINELVLKREGSDLSCESNEGGDQIFIHINFWQNALNSDL